MAGPTCALLLREPLSQRILHDLDELIHRVSDKRDANDFWVRDTHAIGGHYHGERRPFLFAIEQDDRSPAETEQISAHFGWAPRTAIVLAAMSNREEDHAILADLAVWLADRLDAVVDLGGSLPIPAAAGVATVSYETISDTVADYLVVHPDVLRRWLSDPAFRMVK